MNLNLHFPDCLIHTMPQRSEEWHDIRKDKLTASQAGAWLAERPECRLTIPELKAELDRLGEPYKASEARPKLLSSLAGRLGGELPSSHLKSTLDAQHTAVCKILSKAAYCPVPDQWEVDPDGLPPKNPALWAIWNGLRLEPEAVASFAKWSGEEVDEVGFCTHKSGVAGCSPDGLIKGKSIGFEGKAPLPATHVGYLLKGELPETYRDQVHFSMAVTGAESWWFQSYCPGLPPFRILTERSDYTEKMVLGIEDFKFALESAKEEIESIWENRF